MGFRRQVVPASIRNKHRTVSLLAPIKGWVTAVNRATGLKLACLRLENWFPTTTGIRLGGMSTLFATIGTDPVESLFTYVDGSKKEIFAADETKVFDITSVADAEVAPTPAITGQVSGHYSAIPFTTSGGAYLTIVNGTDSPQLYDGTSWQAITAVSSPAITGVTTSLLSQGWVYRNREYFVESGSQSAWYLPVDSIGGAAAEIVLAGVFKRGGTLLFGATWSLDAGDGVDDKCVFVSTEGEIAVYEGAYPGGSDWRLVGRYDMAPPLGKNAWLQIGGDLLIVTEVGLIPISAVISKDVAALTIAAVSRSIEPDWRAAAAARRGLPWSVAKWSNQNMILVATPIVNAGDAAECFPVNSLTGAWCKYTWDTRSLAIHDEWLYFGSSDGTVHKGDIGGDRSGNLVYHTYVGHAENLGSLASYKTTHQCRAQFTASVAFDPSISVSVDYQIDLLSFPDAADTGPANEWDVGLWDVAEWDGGAVPAPKTTMWVSVGLSGNSIMPQIQVTSGSEKTPDAELVSFDVIYEMGSVVV